MVNDSNGVNIMGATAIEGKSKGGGLDQQKKAVKIKILLKGRRDGIMLHYLNKVNFIHCFDKNK